MVDEKKLPYTERMKLVVGRLRAGAAKDPNYDYADGVPKDDLDFALGYIEGALAESSVTFDLFNGFNVTVTGHARSVEVLVQQMIPNPLVKSLRVFDRMTGDYSLKLNYTALKAERSKAKK